MDHSAKYPRRVKKFESLDWGVAKRGALRLFVPSPGVRIEYGVELVAWGHNDCCAPKLDSGYPKVARMLLNVALGRMAVATFAGSGW